MNDCVFDNEIPLPKVLNSVFLKVLLLLPFEVKQPF